MEQKKKEQIQIITEQKITDLPEEHKSMLMDEIEKDFKEK